MSAAERGISLLVTERELDVDLATVLARLGLTPRQAQVLELAIQGTTRRRKPHGGRQPDPPADNDTDRPPETPT